MTKMPTKNGSKSAASTSPTGLGLFRRYGIPPTRIIQAVQDAARCAGWIAPWDNEEQSEEQKSKKKEAGKRSGVLRGGLAEIRRSIIALARTRLSLEYRRAPYSKGAIAALRNEYRSLLATDTNDPDVFISAMLSALSKADKKSLTNASVDTLIKDLKIIRKRNGVTR